MCVWDVASAEPVFQERCGATAIGFSPDGRWLIGAVDHEYRLWQTGTWQREWSVRGEGGPGVVQPADFSPDGRLLALVRRLHEVQLVDPITGGELATLRAPRVSTIQFVKFSPNGRHLVVVTRTHHLQCWDLTALRAALARMGLDWDPRGH